MRPGFLTALFQRPHLRWTRQQWDRYVALQASADLLARWPDAEPLRDELWRAGVVLRAGDVPWTLDAMEVVAEGVRRVAGRCGGDARVLFRGLILILETRTEPWWAPLWRLWYRKPSSVRFGAYQNRGRIHLRADNVRLATLVHEMGHYLDEKRHLSRAYRRRLRAAGLELRTNRFEDLAEAFADLILDRPLDAVRQAYLEGVPWASRR